MKWPRSKPRSTFIAPKKQVAARFPKNSGHNTLADVFDPKKNAFGFFRFLLAAIVLFDHCYALGGWGVEPLHLSAAALVLFFVLSGFLITRSALRTSTARFLWHRFLRLFPGYWVCLVVSAFIFAPIIYQIEYTHAYRIFASPHDSPQAYLGRNFAMLHFNKWTVPGVMYFWPRSVGSTLRDNPFPFIFNGSLWSLPYELICYLGVAILSLFSVVKRARGVLLFVFVLEWSLYGFNWLLPKVCKDFFPYPWLGEGLMFSLYFLAGVLCFLYREEISFSPALLFLSALLLAGALTSGWFSIVAPLTMPYLFLWLACKLPMQHFTAHGDYSYGLYIYAFPIQQGLAFLHMHAAGFLIYFLCSLLLSTLFGVLSYRLIEAPCLRFKDIDARALITKFQAKRPAGCSSPRAHGRTCVSLSRPLTRFSQQKQSPGR